MESTKVNEETVGGSRVVLDQPLATQRTIHFDESGRTTAMTTRLAAAASQPENCFGFGSYQDIFFETEGATKDTQFNYDLIDRYRVRKADLIQWICGREHGDRFPHIALRCNGVRCKAECFVFIGKPTVYL